MIGAIRSELRKVLSTRLWWGLLIAIAALSLLLSWATAALFQSTLLTDTEGNSVTIPWSDYLAITSYHGGVSLIGLTLLLPLALGIVLITAEFRHKTMSWTVLATPRRRQVYASKVVVSVIFGALYGVVHIIAGVGGASLTLIPKDLPFFLGSPDVWISFASLVLAMVLWTLLGLGFGLLLRAQMAAVTIGIGVAFLAQIVLNPILAWREWTLAYKLLPGNLSLNMLTVADLPDGAPGDTTQTAAQYAFDQWWVAALVLLGYAAVMTVVGAWLDSRRDIS